MGKVTMRIVLGLGALALAGVTGYLAVITGGPALTAGGGASMPSGQVRGIVFAVVMAAATLGLLWLAARAFVRASRRSGTDA
jgi:hypothetical protein